MGAATALLQLGLKGATPGTMGETAVGQQIQQLPAASSPSSDKQQLYLAYTWRVGG